MKKSALKWTNSSLLLLFPVQATTGVWMLIGDLLEAEPPELVEGLHVWVGLFLIAAMAVHVALNWTWVKSNLLKKSGA